MSKSIHKSITNKKQKGIRILSVGTDRSIFESASDTQKRIKKQAELVDEMHIVVFSLRSHNLKEEMIGDNIYLYPTHSWSRWLYIFDGWWRGRKVAGRMNKRNLLITSQDAFETGIVAYLVSRYADSPFQLQIHTDFMSPAFVANNRLNCLRVAVARFLVPKAAGIRVVSERIARSIFEFFGRETEAKLSVLPVYVDMEKYTREAGESREMYPQFDTLLLVVARLEREKNVAMAIEALDKIVDVYPKTGLVIVGDGREKESLEQYVHNLGLDHNVKFEGAQHDVMPYYKSADIFLNTSDYEGYGRTLLEAAAAGCPIVTTNVGIVGDILVPERHVLACDLYDVDCVIESVKRIMADRAFGEALSAKAKDSAAKSFIKNENEYFSRFRDLWMECL